MMSVKVSASPSFSCRVHSVKLDYESETAGEASWDVQHLHRNTRTITIQVTPTVQTVIFKLGVLWDVGLN